ncbi:MAG: alpha/beta hydrolase fold domain-containing protein [Planctomycetaceae bacterium]
MTLRFDHIRLATSFLRIGRGCSLALLMFVLVEAPPRSCAAEDDRIPDGITVLYNVRYREGAAKDWVLDLALPSGETEQPRPAIVVIHGGGWLEGDKSSFSTLKNRPPGNIFDFAKLGVVAATINYRLSKDAPFPAALQDCQCAVRWLRANAQTYRIDSDSIGVWGNSAGGHLALMLALADPTAPLEGDAPHGEYSSAVQAVVSDSGPIDLLYQYEHKQIPSAIEQFLGGPPDGMRAAEYQRASPINHVSPRAPPLMLIYGGADTQVGVETSDRLVIALHQAGVQDVTYHRLGTVDHCPHSMVRVPWLVPSVNEFFLRTLRVDR